VWKGFFILGHMNIGELYEVYKKCTSVTIDSRKVSVGDMFFAIKGDRDGNDYALQAIQSGATCAIVDRVDLQGQDKCIYVEDSLQALQSLARHHRQQLNIPVIAITGSVAKTTTKELIAAVLSMRYKVHYTQGNFNNHLGVPLTLLSMPSDTQMAVIEMGANHQKEIDGLCYIAQPTHGIITKIGKAHMEGFGGVAGIIKGKGELYDHLDRTGGLAFVNLEENDLYWMADMRVNMKKNWYTDQYPCALTTDVPTVSFQILSAAHGISQLPGVFNFRNISAAATIGLHFGVEVIDIVKAINTYTPSNHRSQWIEKDGKHILMDAYNANPTSMSAAILGFQKLTGSGPKVLVLGEMRELGASAYQEHKDIMDLVHTHTWHQVVWVGSLWDREEVKVGEVLFNNVDEAKTWMNHQSFQGHYMLLKGSRGVALEKIFDLGAHH
jgi:UDP-N-acetylmuramoyl-tripeptide--D-alanyl-D-alanine ligase